MRTRLTLSDGGAVAIVQPRRDEVDVLCPAAACPECRRQPMRVRGTGQTSVEGDDTYRAPAKCTACGAVVGVLRTKVDTIFGIEEDARVLRGPWKVY